MSYVPPHLRRLPQADTQPKRPAAPAVSEQITKIMPYIPPPLRPGALSHQPTPASSSTRHPHTHTAIRSSSNVIYRFIVLLHHQHMSCQHVTFTPFKERTSTQISQLYTLTPDLHYPVQQQSSTDIAEPHEQIQSNPADVFFKAWKEDLKEMLEKFGRFAQGESCDRVLPVILLQFGRIVFHDRRGFFHWASSRTPEILERDIQKRRLLKTFTTLSRQEFVFLCRMACKDALQIHSEHQFTIRVEDEMKPGSDLWCTCCVRFGTNKKSVSPGKTDDLSENTDFAKPILELIKVMFLPVRHMIGDVARVGEDCDLRLALLMEEYPSLTETELCDLKSRLNDLLIKDDGSWHLRKTPQSSCEKNKNPTFGHQNDPQQTPGRFKVVGISHHIMKIVTNGGLKWHFRYAPNSYEAYVEPIVCQEFFQGRKEWNTEKVLLCIEESLQSIWTV